MKVVESILFCFACLLVFLITGVASCAIRVKYRDLPKVRASLAYSYAGFFGEYSFLQYNQAGGKQGITALLDYLGILQRIQDEKIKYPEKALHFCSDMTYLRLYRLEVKAGNSAKANEYIRSAQNELAILGRKDVSAENLIKSIEAQEAYEEKLYNSGGDVTASVAGQKP
ncbi:MAG TPA: hypothetical protein VIW93_14070 [Candidatus Acidoferrum sp.]